MKTGFDRSGVKRRADGGLRWTLAVRGRRSCFSSWSASRQPRPLHVSVEVQLPRPDGIEHDAGVVVRHPPSKVRAGNDCVAEATSSVERGRATSGPPPHSDFGGGPEPEIVDIPFPFSTSTSEYFDTILACYRSVPTETSGSRRMQKGSIRLRFSLFLKEI